MTIRMAWVLAVVGGAFVLATSTSHAQLDPCPGGGSCAQVTVGDAQGNVGESVRIPISFQQGPDDGGDGGIDEIAAIAFTLDITGFQLADCSNPDANGLTPAIEVPQAVADAYRVVIENTTCGERTRCLCPDAGQDMDSFINGVVFGPKDLPAPGSGPVDIPLLPNGELFAVNLQINGPAGTLPLHVYAETDDQGATAKPQFAAFLSVGDDIAVDQTADRDANESKVLIDDGEVVAEGGVLCTGDCDGNGFVTIGELIRGVAISLGGDIADCPQFDTQPPGGNGLVTIGELVVAVGINIAGMCPVL